MAVVPHHPYFTLFPQLKLKGCHFDTTEVIEAVLNTLTEHDFQEAFKKWQMRWEWCIHFEGVVIVCTKLVFDQMAAPVLEIMDCSFVA
jgi:hypothetical protein